MYSYYDIIDLSGGLDQIGIFSTPLHTITILVGRIEKTFKHRMVLTEDILLHSKSAFTNN